MKEFVKLWGIIIIITLIFTVIIAAFTYIPLILNNKCSNESSILNEDAIIIHDFHTKSPKEGLIDAIKYHNLHNSDIIYAQAQLETGNFTSTLCIEHNNLFGLYDSKNKQYYKFEHWVESVIAYKKYIQNKYIVNEDYYDFLNRINYAEDPNYILKVKILVKQNNKHNKNND